MKCKFVIYGVLLAIPFHTCLTASTAAQDLISAANFPGSGDQTESGTHVSLSEVLDALGKRYRVRFNYNSELIRTKTVSTGVLHTFQDGNLATSLKKLLSPLHLVYEKVGGKQYIIRKERDRDGSLTPIPDIGRRGVSTGDPLRLLSFQEQVVTGRITDAGSGDPLPGVSVLVQGTSNGTSSGPDGFYRLENVPADAILLISFIGYREQEVPLNGRREVDVALEADLESLDEVVVVGYGTQRKSSTTSAISALDGEELTHSPVANINNSIAGRIPGILAFQESGEPGSDATTLRVRGIGTIAEGRNAAALTVVDGIPRDITQLNPAEIESVTVLKDAAAIAPYGLAGANGVILITTKRGAAGQISVNYNGWYGIQRPTRFPDYLNAYDFARLLNAANENVGQPPTYSEEELQKYREGTDPDHFPDHDWVREVINFEAPMTRHDLSFTGGSERVRFFSSLGFLYQEGGVSTINYSRYNLASNVDVDATPTTTISLDIKGTFEQKKDPGSTSGRGIYTVITKQPPLLPAQLQYSNGLPGHELLPQIYHSGYNRQQENLFYSQLSIQQELPFLEGLSIKGVAAFDKAFSFNKHWQTPYTYYALDSEDEFEPVQGGVTAPSLAEQFSQDQVITLQGYLTYQQTFGKHAVNVLGVIEKRNGDWNRLGASRLNFAVDLDELSLGSSNKVDFDNEGISTESKQIGLVSRVAYDYDGKYLFEFSSRYDGHYYFAPGKRFDFFPALSLGWRISEEPFLKDRYSWLDNLKIRGSYGKSGNLAGSAFQYLSSYGVANSYVFGGPQYYQVQGVFERAEANPHITWETARKTDIGLEASLWNGKFGLEADVFYEKRSDMLLYPAETVPLEYGIGISQINAGIMENRGIDLSLRTSHRFPSGIHLNAAFNFTYAKNKLIQTFENEATFNNPNRRRTGRAYETRFGYKALGYFQSEEEIEGWATQFGDVRPGDIKYADMNGDGRITPEDEVVIGKPLIPQIIYGLVTELSWKGIGLNMLWQGAGSSSIYLANEAALPFFNGAKAFQEHLDYWRPDNPDARYPRVTPSPTTNNSQTSSFWVRDGSYLRLKSLELGYAIPQKALSATGIGSLRVYVSGQNLITFSAVDFLDPELSNNRARYYFQQKVYSFGLNIGF